MEKQLTADLNVVANSNLEIQLLDGDLNIIQKLDDEPNDVGGLTSAELKSKFDESGNIIKKYINETLIPAVLTDDATEESRKQAEAARVAAEQGRVTAEEGRVSAETARAAAEQARSEAESSRVSAENAREAAETARADETAGIVARATGQANAAASSASQAAVSEQGARDAAGTANNAAYTANGAAAAASSSAAQAQSSAATAAQSAASVDGVNKTAQSWAVGGTGTRPGEDTDNAKYWAQQAQTAVGGDFATKTEAQGYVTAHNESNDAHPDLRVAVASSVRYDEAQNLTDEQKAQARANIGADTVQGAVRYDAAQSLTDGQKTQARGNIGAAPDGFGLGTYTGPLVTDCDNAKMNGWYYCDKSTAHTPDSNYNWHIHVTALGNDICMQDAWTITNTNAYLHRRRLVYIDTATQNNPWEWVNPPMHLGTEYRTTERYLGKPVYCKLVDFGALPNKTQKYIAHGAENVDYVIQCYGHNSTYNSMPVQNVTSMFANRANIYITTDADLSVRTATIGIKYTKTTD